MTNIFLSFVEAAIKGVTSKIEVEPSLERDADGRKDKGDDKVHEIIRSTSIAAVEQLTIQTAKQTHKVNK